MQILLFCLIYLCIYNVLELWAEILKPLSGLSGLFYLYFSWSFPAVSKDSHVHEMLLTLKGWDQAQAFMWSTITSYCNFSTQQCWRKTLTACSVTNRHCPCRVLLMVEREGRQMEGGQVIQSKASCGLSDSLPQTAEASGHCPHGLLTKWSFNPCATRETRPDTAHTHLLKTSNGVFSREAQICLHCNVQASGLFLLLVPILKDD